MFGHEKSAFTGELIQRIGPFELADGARCFWIEMATSAWSFSPNYCGLFRSRSSSLGSSRTISVNVGSIAATIAIFPP